MKESEIAVICKALGDENRVQIIKMLTGGELCACKILDAFNPEGYIKPSADMGEDTSAVS